ncbi:LamG domain-containing protein [Kitasatospora viridis]|uniref:Concanavalin A-like lectin/glucanase superfamily protein n=1 Tax=Kitasatospora viridis TaxID=281105 RepID=A0A561UF88_9ACTN|nr:LamG domain-containing protein [Kitasatospora viridis]TWF98005.1 concanavalin A-like lectin/glucanase superfamily protein [Kitasatospora viridis]
MSEGNETPAEWTRGPARPGEGEPQPPHGGPGSVTPPQGGFGPPQGGFGPPPEWYGPAGGQPQPGAGGYGQPQPQAGGYGQPQPAAGGYGYPQPEPTKPNLLVPMGTGDQGGPDWAAMADAHERGARKKRRLRVGIALVGVLALAGAATVAVLHFTGKKSSSDQSVKPAPTGPAAPGECIAPTPAASAASNTNDASVGGGGQVGTVDGHTGSALTVHGTPDGYAESNSVVLNTCKSFTVSAVVRNDAPTGGRAAVSQGGDGFFSYYLGRDFWGDHNQWVFKVQTAASDSSSREALSTAPATTGQWTTLTGVYDAGNKSIALYVDGVLTQTTPVPGILSTNGPIEIGRARFKSQWTDSWSGSIADVQIWERPLAPDVIAQLAKTRSADVGPRASWYRY